MATWATENDINNFFNVVPPCGRGQSLQVLQYLQQKGISPSPITSSRASSVASSSAGSDEERIFRSSARSPGTCAGRGMMLRNYDGDRVINFEGGRERWDNAVYNQLRRANKDSYTTDLFEYQLKMMHKAQEEREKKGQFEEAIVDDDVSSVGTSASCVGSTSSSPSPSSSSCSVPAKSSKSDVSDKANKSGETTDVEYEVKKIEEATYLEEETKKCQVTDDVVQQVKPAYKSVRSRNVLLNSLAKMALEQSSSQDLAGGDQKGTEHNVGACSSPLTSDESANTSPLIFDSAAGSPQPFLNDQNSVSECLYESKQDHNGVLLFNEDTLTHQFQYNENVSDNVTSPYYMGTSPDVSLVPGNHFKKKIDYPSIVGHYYNNHNENTAVNYDDERCIFRANSKSCKFTPPSKSCKFTPPSLVGLESLNYSLTKFNSYNTNFELKPEEFPPLK